MKRLGFWRKTTFVASAASMCSATNGPSFMSSGTNTRMTAPPSIRHNKCVASKTNTLRRGQSDMLRTSCLRRSRPASPIALTPGTDFSLLSIQDPGSQSRVNTYNVSQLNCSSGYSYFSSSSFRSKVRILVNFPKRDRNRFDRLSIPNIVRILDIGNRVQIVFQPARRQSVWHSIII